MELGCDPIENCVQCVVNEEISVVDAVTRVCQAVLRIASLPHGPADAAAEVGEAEARVADEQHLESIRSSTGAYAAEIDHWAAQLIDGLNEALRYGSVSAAAAAVGLSCDALEALVSGSASLSTADCVAIGIGTAGAWPVPPRVVR